MTVPRTKPAPCIPRKEWEGKPLLTERGVPLCIYCRKPAFYVGAGPPHWTTTRIEDRGGQRTIHFEAIFAHHDCIAKAWIKEQLRNRYSAAKTRKWLKARLLQTRPPRRSR